MTDKTSSPVQEPEAGTVTETTGTETTGTETTEAEQKEKEKLAQTVEIQDVGPCKKHIKVSIDRASINKLLDEKFGELIREAVIPGFRKGRAPRRVVERQYGKSVTQEVKGQLLMASLEQLAEEFDVAPLAPPNIDPGKIDIPAEGDMIYEFDVEVRPDFDLPVYKGLRIKRYVRKFTDADVALAERRLLSQYGQLVPKEGPAELEDRIVCDMTTRLGDRVIGTAKEVTLAVNSQLAFKDGVAEKFGEQVVGVKAGETRVVEITMSAAVAVPELVGQKVQATLEVKDVKALRLPELTEEFLRELGVTSVEQMRERILALLERRHEYEQRKFAREQVLNYIESAATWDLPQDLLMRQARSAMSRRVMEMREAGIPDEEIRARQRILQQDVLRSTANSLKEHFVLQKIAEVEKIDVSDEEIKQEIELLADQMEESPRRVRARLEKEGELQTLAAMIIERKVLDLILDSAEYEDVPFTGEAEQPVGVAETQAVEGELKDPTAPPPEPTPESALEGEQQQKNKPS